MNKLKSLSQVWQVRMLLALSLTWIAPTLACGSFAPRPSPTPTPPVATVAPELPGAAVDPAQAAAPAPPVQLAATDTPIPAPTPTFTPTPPPGSALAAGQPARITAPNGLNMRDVPSASGTLILQLGTGQRVTVQEGPTSAENFTWWKVDDGQGNSGWVAEGDGETVWLSPQIGEPQAVNRPPKVGDRVSVTMPVGGQLSVRATPGTAAALLTRVNPGAQLTVLAGPQQGDGFTWYQIRSDDGTIEGWAADGDGSVRWLSPLE